MTIGSGMLKLSMARSNSMVILLVLAINFPFQNTSDSITLAEMAAILISQEDVGIACMFLNTSLYDKDMVLSSRRILTSLNSCCKNSYSDTLLSNIKFIYHKMFSLNSFLAAKPPFFAKYQN